MRLLWALPRHSHKCSLSQPKRPFSRLSRLARNDDINSTAFTPQKTTEPAPQATPIVPLAFTTQQNHNDLQSFLKYVKRQSGNFKSTTFAGTVYEYSCLDALSSLGFRLERNGGRADKGIDLMGYWNLAGFQKSINALVQCKALKAKASPSIVRELEGAAASRPALWKADSAVISILCSTRQATKGVRDAVKGSREAVLWAVVDKPEFLTDVETTFEDVEAFLTDHKPRVKQLLWNQNLIDVVATRAEGILGVLVKRQLGTAGADVQQALFTWNSEVIKPI